MVLCKFLLMRKLILILLLISSQAFGQSPMFKLIAKKANTCTNKLLDDYSGAALAYSFRLLDCQYAGSSCRVRRSSDDAEQDIGFLSSGYLDTATMKTFVGANSGYVVTWYDQSGNSQNGTTPSNAAQPRIINSGTVERDGLGNVQCIFDGSNDEITSPYQQSGAGVDFSIFAVLQANSDGSMSPDVIQNQFFTLGVISSTNWGFALVQIRGQGVFDGVFYQSADMSATSGFESFIAYSSWNEAVDRIIRYRRNGTDGTNSGTTGGTIRQGTGGEIWLAGGASEVIIYPNSQHSNRAAIESNMNSFYLIF